MTYAEKKKQNTKANIRKACNELVYMWKRKYSKSLIKREEAPEPLTIPQIAIKACIAPKTIYTNEEYKSIALTAIAKTTVDIDEELFDFQVGKQSYSPKEVSEILAKIKADKDDEIKSLSQICTSYIKELDKVKSKLEDVDSIITKHIIVIAELEKENASYKQLLKTLKQSG